LFPRGEEGVHIRGGRAKNKRENRIEEKKAREGAKEVKKGES
jgi:hypothetical protein